MSKKKATTSRKPRKRPITFSSTTTPFLKVPLTKDMIAIANIEDFELLSRHTWYYSYGYAATKVKLPDGKWKLLYMHRLIMDTPDDMDTDHINGDPLDNRRENLRICTRAENSRNQKRSSNNTSGYKGVSWHKRVQRFQANIKLNGIKKHIGYFDDPEEAAAAYDAAAVELHKDFARTNY